MRFDFVKANLGKLEDDLTYAKPTTAVICSESCTKQCFAEDGMS